MGETSSSCGTPWHESHSTGGDTTRARSQNDAVSVDAIAGTHVIMLGIDATEKARESWKWLSRGLEEALLNFIGQAKGPDW